MRRAPVAGLHIPGRAAALRLSGRTRSFRRHHRALRGCVHLCPVSLEQTNNLAALPRHKQTPLVTAGHGIAEARIPMSEVVLSMY